jgi:hypothetical protein
MDSDEITIPVPVIFKHLNEWREKNPTVMHPMTQFLDEIGLHYLKLSKNNSYRLRVVDKQKWFIAKIKYAF